MVKDQNRRASCKKSDSQTMIDIYRILMGYEGLFHLILRLRLASRANEITLVGDHMKSDLLPTGTMRELRQSNIDCHSIKFYGLWRVISFDVTTACCLNIK